MIERVWLFVENATSSPENLKRQIQTIRELQVTDVAIYVNGNTTCDFELSPQRAESTKVLCQRLHDIDVDTHLVTWLHPNKDYIANAAASLRPLCKSTNARSLIFNAEDAWKDGEKFVCRQKDKRGKCLNRGTAKCKKSRPQKKGRSMTKKIKTVTNNENWKPFKSWPCPLGITDIANIRGYSRHRLEPLIDRCFYIMPQPQSTKKNIFLEKFDDAQKSWRGFLNLIYSSGVPIIIPKPMIMVITTRNGTSIEAMKVAIEAIENSKAPRMTEVAYWSYLNIKDSDRLSTATRKARAKRRAFIRNVSRKARAGIPQSQSIDLVDIIEHLERKIEAT